MPGLFGLLWKRDGGGRERNEKITSEMRSCLMHLPHYRFSSESDARFILGNVGFHRSSLSEMVWDRNRQVGVWLEGRVYKCAGREVPAGGENGKATAEKILGLFQEDPDAVPLSLEGTFNVAVLDARSSTELHLYNDRFGFRRLYFHDDAEIFFFVPEIKGFLALGGFRVRVDRSAAADLFNYYYPLGDHSLLDGVSLLPPASHLRVSLEGRLVLRSYWCMRFEDRVDGEVSEWLEEGHVRFERSLQRRLEGAQEVIVPLSGGMDSRFILATAAKLLPDVQVVTHGTPRCLDYRIARRVVKELGIRDYRFVEIQPAWLERYARRAVWFTEGMVELSCYVLMGVCESILTPQGILLNGIFGGPMNFGAAYYSEADVLQGLSREEKLRRIQRTLYGEGRGEAFYAVFHREFADLLRQSYLERVEEEFGKVESCSGLFCNQKDAFFILNRLRRYMNQVDLNRYYWDEQFPLADYALLDYYLALPVRLKLRRRLYREMILRKYPRLARIPWQATGVNLDREPSRFRLLSRRYRTQFGYYLGRITRGRVNLLDPLLYVHYNQWYRTHEPFRRFFEDLLLSDRCLSRGYFDRAGVQRLLTRQREGGDSFYLISNLATFELFNRLFLESDPYDRRS